MLDRRYRTFHTAARLKSISQASRVMNLTQPAVTQQIHSLEESLAMPLFIRENRKIDLTEPGRVLFDYVSEVLNTENALNRDLLVASNKKRQFTLGATLTIGEYEMPRLLGLYAASHPEDRVSLVIENTERICRRLEENTIDLAIVEGPFDRKKFEHLLLKKDDLILAAPGDAVTPETPLKVEDLKDLDLILRERGSGTRKTFEEAYTETGLPLDEIEPAMSVGSLTAIMKMVQQGLGWTIISRLAASERLSAGTLVEVPVEDFAPQREFQFLWNRRCPESFGRRFREFCLANT